MKKVFGVLTLLYSMFFSLILYVAVYEVEMDIYTIPAIGLFAIPLVTFYKLSFGRKNKNNNV